ncbi:hypothetical protein Patl1_30942 [Pistacia atlantica]|uniref:Uncharacterized protein n=1 Tax=Pistacia atlantica TaxID=434234 RepID=A0ACC1AE71_9ROSI|nr:hypothetical protein Patl1_30942 [Pistacia atlantica]
MWCWRGRVPREAKPQARTSTLKLKCRTIESRWKEDEELMLETLPRLPSPNQGNLADGVAGAETNDVWNLSRRFRQLVVQNAMATNDQDNYKLLSATRERLDSLCGYLKGWIGGAKGGAVEVRFQNLKVVADVQTGSRALPTLINVTRDLSRKTYSLSFYFPRLLSSLRIFRPQRYSLNILNDNQWCCEAGKNSWYLNNFLELCRMTLLLGPPGSGKSTLLLALAGKLSSNLEISGDITYNGHKLHEFHVQRTSAYISQMYHHIADLTVRETLDFAARCQGSSEAFAGEMFVGPRKTLFMDEISNGLDSSTTHKIVKCVKNSAQQMDATRGIWYIKAPEAEVSEFFESLGFRLLARKAVADFLQELSTGQIPQDNTNSFLFQKWQMLLKFPTMEGLYRHACCSI